MPLPRLELETSGFDTMMERIMDCIPPNPRRVGYIDPIHEPLYMAHICTNTIFNSSVLNSQLHMANTIYFLMLIH